MHPDEVQPETGPEHGRQIRPKPEIHKAGNEQQQESNVKAWAGQKHCTFRARNPVMGVTKHACLNIWRPLAEKSDPYEYRVDLLIDMGSRYELYRTMNAPAVQAIHARDGSTAFVRRSFFIPDFSKFPEESKNERGRHDLLTRLAMNQETRAIAPDLNFQIGFSSSSLDEVLALMHSQPPVFECHTLELNSEMLAWGLTLIQEDGLNVQIERPFKLGLDLNILKKLELARLDPFKWTPPREPIRADLKRFKEATPIWG